MGYLFVDIAPLVDVYARNFIRLELLHEMHDSSHQARDYLLMLCYSYPVATIRVSGILVKGSPFHSGLECALKYPEMTFAPDGLCYGFNCILCGPPMGLIFRVQLVA